MWARGFAFVLRLPLAPQDGRHDYVVVHDGGADLPVLLRGPPPQPPWAGHIVEGRREVEGLQGVWVSGCSAVCISAVMFINA